MTILKTKDNLFYGQVKLATTIRKGVDEEWDEKTIYWYDSDGYITKKERETIYDHDITVFHYNSKKQLTERVEGEGDYQIIERYFYNPSTIKQPTPRPQLHRLCSTLPCLEQSS